MPITTVVWDTPTDNRSETDIRMNWYALKVFYKRHAAIEATLQRDGVESYIPKRSVPTLRNGRMTDIEQPLDPMLMFVHSTEEYIAQLDRMLHEKAMVYHYPGTQEPAPIPDAEMEMFRFIVSAGDNGLEIIGTPPENKTRGERYRVIGGPLEGIEGFLVRIRSTRRLVIEIGTVMCIATSYIPQKYLQKIGRASL